VLHIAQLEYEKSQTTTSKKQVICAIS